MSTAKKVAWIAVGYALAVVGGYAAVAINELLMPAETAQGSPGMVAFGDMVLFVLAVGFLGLLPTCFLLKLLVDKVPRALLATVLLLAALGPASWLAVAYLAGNPPVPDQPSTTGAWAGLLLAFGAIPRIVAGPVLLVVEAATFFMVRGRVSRTLLAAATLMDIVPITMFVMHMASRPY
jgi:hypothetical protein